MNHLFHTLVASVSLVALAFVSSRHDDDQGAKATQDGTASISSRDVKTAAGERVLIEEILLEAPVADVWSAYTTNEGWTAWASPVAEVDLRNGGTIRTHYDKDAQIGSPGTNTLHIVNYVPERLLTLRADLQDNWPEVMKQDAGHLMNVIVFEPIDKTRTRIRSYGCGYGTSPAYEELLKFFIPANAGLYRKLKEHVEK